MRTEDTLRKIPMLRSFTDDMLTALVAKSSPVRFAKGEVVCHENEQSDSMFVLLDGEVRIYKSDDEGTKVDLFMMKSGECFGELSMLDGKGRSATVACLTPCTVLKVEKHVFMEILVSAHSLELLSSVFAELVHRVRQAAELAFEKALAQKTLQSEMEAERHRAVAEMVAGVAHELNTPLGVVNSGVSVLASCIRLDVITEALSDVPEAQIILEDIQEAISLIERNIARAHKLVENFKHISVNHFIDERQVVDLSVLVDEVVELFTLNKRKRHLQIQVDNQLPPTGRSWSGYPGRLTQVITNLILNAERHAYPNNTSGEIHITLALDEAAPGGPRYILCVQDFGKGIPAEHLSQIFTPFFTTTRGEGGTGLGLAIVHSTVTEGLGGTLDVTSELGQGTTFRILLPQSVP